MKTLLFDLGGVVINWTGLQELQNLLGERYGLEEIRLKMIANPLLQQFERGQCSAEAFAEAFIQDFELPFCSSEFIDIFASWVGAPYSGVIERLRLLRLDYRLACLSNTNEVHWQHLTENVGIGEMFDHCYASHLLGVSKPDLASFGAVIDLLETAPENICFFDDAPENILAAGSVGMKAIKVSARTGVLPHLESTDFFDR